MRFANYDEMEEAVQDEYEEQILELKEEAISLHRQIDALKHEVDCAESEAYKAQQEEESLRKENLSLREFVMWVQEDHPDIIITYQVIRRLEGTDGDRVDSTK